MGDTHARDVRFFHFWRGTRSNTPVPALATGNPKQSVQGRRISRGRWRRTQGSRLWLSTISTAAKMDKGGSAHRGMNEANQPLSPSLRPFLPALQHSRSSIDAKHATTHHCCTCCARCVLYAAFALELLALISPEDLVTSSPPPPPVPPPPNFDGGTVDRSGRQLLSRSACNAAALWKASQRSLRGV